MLAEGKAYFLDVWNLFDLVGYFSFWMIYFGLFNQPEHKSKEILLKVAVILNMLVKMNFFLRIFSKYGLLVNLVSQCFKDIIQFVNYLIIWLLTFTMLYIQTGILAPSRASLNEVAQVLIFVWENSVGNIEDPIKKSFENDPSSMQVGLMWTVWVAN